MTRPDWDRYFLDIAARVAARGDCTRSQVGAVLVRADRSVCATGYNGVAPGAAGCLAGACPRGRLTYKELPSTEPYNSGPGFCVAQHAEINALMFLPDTERAHTCYVTRRPCRDCHMALLMYGVDRIVWPEGEWTPGCASS